MTFDDFLASLDHKEPPELPPVLRALWYDKKQQWHQAHQIAQEVHDRNGSWVHAYLHREEGDKWNAGYWYDRAGKKMPDYSLEEEWDFLVKYFLNRE